MHAVHSMESAILDVDPPLQRLEHGLHGFVAFVVMPIFALANAGVAFGADFATLATDTVALAIALGLVVGKPIGVMGLAFLAVKTGLAGAADGHHLAPRAGRELPDGHRVHHVHLHRQPGVRRRADAGTAPSWASWRRR